MKISMNMILEVSNQEFKKVRGLIPPKLYMESRMRAKLLKEFYTKKLLNGLLYWNGLVKEIENLLNY